MVMYGESQRKALEQHPEIALEALLDLAKLASDRLNKEGDFDTNGGSIALEFKPSSGGEKERRMYLLATKDPKEKATTVFVTGLVVDGDLNYAKGLLDPVITSTEKSQIPQSIRTRLESEEFVKGLRVAAADLNQAKKIETRRYQSILSAYKAI